MSAVDRAALIEAAAEATGNICCDEHAIRDAEAVIDAVLPLVAQAIEAQRPHIPPSNDPKRRESIIIRSTLNHASRLVRSLAEETP